MRDTSKAKSPRAIETTDESIQVVALRHQEVTVRVTDRGFVDVSGIGSVLLPIEAENYGLALIKAAALGRRNGAEYTGPSAA